MLPYTGFETSPDLRPSAVDFQNYVRALGELGYSVDEAISLIAERVMILRTSVDDDSVPARPGMRELKATMRKLLSR